jgi:N-acetylmuramoyl-L-alanine amidase
MVIGINAGHTLSGQPGCGVVGIIDESVETRKVAYYLSALFSEAGYTVIDCTNNYAESEDDDLNKIVSLANAQELDLFISLHFNAGGGNGVEVYTYGGTEHTEAVRICSALSKLGFANRGVKDGSSLAVIRRTDAKAILVEICFADSQSDIELYKKLGAKRIAEEIFTAVTGQEISEEDIDMSVATELKADIEALKEKYDTIINKMGEEIDVLKKAAEPVIYDYIDENMPKWAQEGVKWCVENGIIKGTGDGKLGLDDKDLKYCTIIMRAVEGVLEGLSKA